MEVFLKTQRLILKKFKEEDMEAIFLILKDEEVNKFLPWYPIKDLEETKKFYEERYAVNMRCHRHTPMLFA
jgi:ribosomal-protein-alanine N-acetyltransferase